MPTGQGEIAIAAVSDARTVAVTKRGASACGAKGICHDARHSDLEAYPLTARILIVDGVPAASQERLAAHGGARLGDAYQAALRSQLPAGLGDLECIILAAGDGIPLLNDFALSDFHGIAWTGSPLSAFEELDAVKAQVEFARTAFRSGVPCFGSCWGLQVMSVALGGRVHRHSRGPEVGVARQITLTDAGRAHPMYDGKAAVFDALCVHQDEVCRLPAGACLLAGNEFSAIQAAEMTDGDRSFWGVQYHPEYDLAQIAALFSVGAQRLVAAGFAATLADAETIAVDFKALHFDARRKDLAWRYGIGADILDPQRHRLEFANWLAAKVLPRASSRT
jgi:GMP synthase (glutamine-hydrolysing)